MNRLAKYIAINAVATVVIAAMAVWGFSALVASPSTATIIDIEQKTFMIHEEFKKICPLLLESAEISEADRANAEELCAVGYRLGE